MSAAAKIWEGKEMAGKPGPIAAGLRVGSRAAPIEEEERLQILAAYKEGGKARDIARDFKRSEQTVTMLARQAGLFRRPPRPRRHVTFQVVIGEEIRQGLERAGKRRDLSPQELASMILIGVMHGVADIKLDHALELANAYEADYEKRANAEATEMLQV